MINEEQLIAYLSGEIRGKELERFENELAESPVALRQLVEQEKIEAALAMMLGMPDREQIRESVVAGVAAADRELKAQIQQQIRREAKEKAVADEKARRGGKWFGWFRRLPVPAQLGAMAALALVCFILGKPGDGLKSPGSLRWAKSRSTAEWPFASDSPWNTPIGSGAIYLEPVGVDLTLGAVFFDAEAVHPRLRSRRDDPVGRIFENGMREPVATLPLPLTRMTNEGAFAVISADGRTLYDILGGRVVGLDIRARQVAVADLLGSGVPPDYIATTSSGLSTYAGSLSAAEFTRPIRRALGAVVDPSIISRRADGSASVWPARRVPGESFTEGGNIHIGSLLAIPPEVEIREIGVGTEGPLHELAAAMQNYGVYVKDPHYGGARSPVNRDERAPLLFCGDLGDVNLPRDFQRKLALITRHLKVVGNNTPSAVGGGGRRALPQAPGFRK